MVGRRILLAALLLAAAAAAAAQGYSVADTLTEYPNAGTWYHDRFEGRKTASGDIFDQNGFTAAHWKIKLGTYVLVTNRNTGQQVIVKVNDRCPKHGVLDMTHRAATAIGIKGCQPVTLRILPAGHEAEWAAQDARFDSVWSRYAPHQPKYPLDPKRQAAYEASHKTAPRAAAPAHALPAPPPAYDLTLATASSQAEADALVLNLPLFYQDKVSIAAAADSGRTLILRLGLDRNHAEELRRALEHSFPACRLRPAGE